MDLGGALAYWVQADDGFLSRAFRRQPTHTPGMLTRREVVDYYRKIGLCPLPSSMEYKGPAMASYAEYYGDSTVIDGGIDMEWARIPHFFMNFYVFQYATGFSAAMALSQRILNGGEQAVKDYLGFLSGGCSKKPIELLRGAGVDMTSPEPIKTALDTFGKLLDEFEELMKD